MQHLLLRFDELAGEACYETFAPFLRHLRMIISKLGCCCSHPEGAQTLSATLCKWDQQSLLSCSTVPLLLLVLVVDIMWNGVAM